MIPIKVVTCVCNVRICLIQPITTICVFYLPPIINTTTSTIIPAPLVHLYTRTINGVMVQLLLHEPRTFIYIRTCVQMCVYVCGVQGNTIPAALHIQARMHYLLYSPIPFCRTACWIPLTYSLSFVSSSIYHMRCC